MGTLDWLKRSISNIRSDGFEGLADGAYELYAGGWRYLGWHVPRGVNIYDLDWDVLVILDACRTDLLREVEDEYGFIKDIDVIESIGSMSEEWLVKTFTKPYSKQIEKTAYITANVFSGEVLDKDQFLLLDEVWKYGWDDSTKTVPPWAITQRAIAVGREINPEFLVVHYLQPHHPFIATELDGSFDSDPFGSQNKKTVVDALRKGEIARDLFWGAYKDNLRLVLNDVEILLENMDADRVVLTADHGEAIGEWFIYGHPAGALHPVVKNVPWVETTAKDTHQIEPDLEPPASLTGDAKQRLKDLGYLQ